MASSSSALLLLAVLLALGLSASACGGYGPSCRFISFTGTTLNLECQRSSGLFFAPTRINVAYCLEVEEDGTLSCRELENPVVGKSKCSNIHTAAKVLLDTDTTLTATCEDSSGTPVTSSIDLNTCLGNDNGNIRCCPPHDNLEVATGELEAFKTG